jgi:putative nucleotidyltransferase with HDIG domain
MNARLRRTTGQAGRPAPHDPFAACLDERALLHAVETHDGATATHCCNVLDLASAVARRLGLAPEEVEEIARVALLHDVGKLVIPHSILAKPGPLTPDEWVVVRAHPVVGSEAVARVTGRESLARAVRASHERWDGTGYPDGLARDDIPLASRITFVCDAYDAMRSDRPYRSARHRKVAIAELLGNAGTQFCPRCTDAVVAEVIANDYEPRRGKIA